MSKVARVASPAAIAVLRQATALWPKRRKSSDGLLPSSAHLRANPKSDHNTGLAVDLSHDPHSGVDCGDIFKRLQADPRVAYLIFSGKIWTPDKGTEKYDGANQHIKHLHISIKPAYSKDTSPWFGWMEEPTTINKVKARLKRKAKKKEDK